LRIDWRSCKAWIVKIKAGTQITQKKTQITQILLGPCPTPIKEISAKSAPFLRHLRSQLLIFTAVALGRTQPVLELVPVLLPLYNDCHPAADPLELIRP